MGNHIHLIVRTRPDVAQHWEDREVVRRWLVISKLKRNGADRIVEPSEAQMNRELKRPGRVAELRRRLADVSWFMGTLCENMSRRCNRESGRSGAFWEHRFGCRNLADEAAIVVCGIYVDLNQVRAGEALTPEQSRHTSAYNRIEGRRQRQARAAGEESADLPAPDSWLCELSLEKGGPSPTSPTNPSPVSWRASDTGLLSISLEDYLQLLDWTGRQVRSDKRGAIPASLAPILERLGINQEVWLDAVTSFDGWFGAVVGPLSAMASAAQRAGRKWLRGAKRCGLVFN
jgi:hypothetical protein